MGQVAAVDVPGLVAHFESVLGPVRSGWVSAPTGELMPFQVVRFARGSDVGSLAYATLGLSRHPLWSRQGRIVRQELLVLARPSLPSEYLVQVLHDAGRVAVATGRPLRRGELLGPVPPPVPGSAMAALYVALPVYFPDDFATFIPAATPAVIPGDGREEPDRSAFEVELLWLVPVTDEEAAHVREHGWEPFEELLAAQDPDLVDVYRLPVVLDSETS